MRDNRAAGVFVGHTEGVTYVDSKGDGRYVLSNGKDQTMKLWDLRKMMSTEQAAKLNPRQYGTGFDYRFMSYSDAHYDPHPHDCSVVTYRGHRVLKTLIRCHFSPPDSTNSRYVYSGSEDGKVYVYNLDATIAGKIDVQATTRNTRPPGSGVASRYYLDEAETQTWKTCVRDASWHPNVPMLAGESRLVPASFILIFSQLHRGTAGAAYKAHVPYTPGKTDPPTTNPASRWAVGWTPKCTRGETCMATRRPFARQIGRRSAASACVGQATTTTNGDIVICTSEERLLFSGPYSSYTQTRYCHRMEGVSGMVHFRMHAQSCHRFTNVCMLYTSTRTVPSSTSVWPLPECKHHSPLRSSDEDVVDGYMYCSPSASVWDGTTRESY